MPREVASIRGNNARYSLTHLTDARLVRGLQSLLARDRANMALLLAHIAEVDARRLYVVAGYASMFCYCVEKLHLSEDAAYRRIRAARAARQFPLLFDVIAEGRLHLAAVSAIAPHLTAESASDLIQAATHRRKSEIEGLLASRFPSTAPEPPTIVRAISSPPQQPVGGGSDGDQLVLGRVEEQEAERVRRRQDRDVEGELSGEGELVLGRVANSPSDETAASSLLGATATPPPERFLVQVTVPRSTRDKLRTAQALLSHSVPNGDVAQVLDRALDALIAQLEKRKVGSRRSQTLAGARAPDPSPMTKPTRPPTRGGRVRYIPAWIRRAVWERDGGRCSFVSVDGHRCSEVRFLEFDHVEPLARGGRTTVEGLRLRCRPHNQYEAECAFGTAFMKGKREQSRSQWTAGRTPHAEAGTAGGGTAGGGTAGAGSDSAYSR